MFGNRPSHGLSQKPALTIRQVDECNIRWMILASGPQAAPADAKWERRFLSSSAQIVNSWTKLVLLFQVITV